MKVITGRRGIGRARVDIIATARVRVGGRKPVRGHVIDFDVGARVALGCRGVAERAGVEPPVRAGRS